MWILRKVLSPLGTMEAMEFLMDKLHGTKTNQEFCSRESIIPSCIWSLRQDTVAGLRMAKADGCGR